MNFLDMLSTASSNMFRSKVRTSLTIIAIIIGAMTITLTNGIGTGVKSYLNQQIGNLGSTNVLIVQLTDKNATNPGSGPAKYQPSSGSSVSSRGGGLGAREQQMMNSSDLTTISAIPNITTVTPAHSLSPDYIAGTAGKYQVSLSQQLGSTSHLQLVAGSPLNSTSPQYQITIPVSYVGPLGYSTNQAIIGKPVTIGVTSAEGVQSIVTATVTGVQQKNLLGETTAYANITLANQINNIQNIGIPTALANTFLTAYATFPSNLTTAQLNTVKKHLTDKGFTGKTIKDEENTIFSVINAIIIVFDMFGIIALLAASFGIINTLFMTVQERTKEIGLMKALGMSPRKIFVLFSIEAVLIGFWGSILGVGLAMLIGRVINNIGKHGFLKNLPGLNLLTFPVGTIATVIIGIMVIAFLAGTLPALRASRKDPIEALRYE